MIETFDQVSALMARLRAAGLKPGDLTEEVLSGFSKGTPRPISEISVTGREIHEAGNYKFGGFDFTSINHQAMVDGKKEFNRNSVWVTHPMYDGMNVPNAFVVYIPHAKDGTFVAHIEDYGTHIRVSDGGNNGVFISTEMMGLMQDALNRAWHERIAFEALFDFPVPQLVFTQGEKRVDLCQPDQNARRMSDYKFSLELLRAAIHNLEAIRDKLS